MQLYLFNSIDVAVHPVPGLEDRPEAALAYALNFLEIIFVARCRLSNEFQRSYFTEAFISFRRGLLDLMISGGTDLADGPELASLVKAVLL